MIPAARIAAAIEILADIETRRRPAADALKDWGLARRFAGSGDRAAIASLVYDALRRKASSAWIMGEASPRAEVIGALKQLRSLGEDEISALFTGEGHAPAPLSEAERERLRTGDLSDAPAHVRGDYPEWLAPAFAESFGDGAVEEGRALANRAPVDLRVNTLKTEREQALAALAHLDAAPTPLSPVGLRIAVRAGRPRAGALGRARLCQRAGRGAGRGLAARRAAERRQARHAGARSLRRRRRQDLALAAMMDNQGQIYATDTDGRRLAPIFDRLARSGARNVQVRAPRGTQDRLTDLDGTLRSRLGRCALQRVRAPGGAIPTPNGACAPARWSSASRTRWKRLKARRNSSSRAAGWSTSPVRC